MIIPSAIIISVLFNLFLIDLNQFKHSFINCYKHLLSKPWYLCLGNHDVEPIGDRDDMGLYQI